MEATAVRYPMIPSALEGQLGSVTNQCACPLLAASCPPRRTVRDRALPDMFAKGAGQPVQLISVPADLGMGLP